MKASKTSARERILEVAFKSFTERGYQGSTTHQIAIEAEVNEVTIFRHFKNKQLLFSAVLKEYFIEKHILGIDEDAIFAKHKDNPTAFFYALSEVVAKHYKKTIPLIRMQLMEGNSEKFGPEVSETIVQIPQAALGKLKDIFQKCARLGWIKKRESYDSLCLSFYGPFFALFMNKANFGDLVFKEPEGKLMKEITENFLNSQLC